jgi:hypothetical protein
MENKQRRKLLKRDSEERRPAVRLTERDVAIIQAVYEYRALTTTQIQRLLFPACATAQSVRGRQVVTQQRLKLLYHNEYLTRDERPTRLSEGRQALVYFLDKRGAQLLATYLKIEPTQLDWRPRDNVAGAGHLFLDHLLHTNDVRLSLSCAAEASGCRITQWIDDRSLRRREMKEYVTLKSDMGTDEKVAIVPDGYFSLVQGDKVFHHFIEVDLATVVGLSSKSGRRDWARKVRAYLAYYQSGQYTKRYGARLFRVLTVTTGAGRLENLQQITEQAGGKNIFWFTTFDALIGQSLLTSPIWNMAGREGLSPLV